MNTTSCLPWPPALMCLLVSLHLVSAFTPVLDRSYSNLSVVAGLLFDRTGAHRLPSCAKVPPCPLAQLVLCADGAISIPKFALPDYHLLPLAPSRALHLAVQRERMVCVCLGHHLRK